MHEQAAHIRELSFLKSRPNQPFTPFVQAIHIYVDDWILFFNPLSDIRQHCTEIYPSFSEDLYTYMVVVADVWSPLVYIKELKDKKQHEEIRDQIGACSAHRSTDARC